MFLFCREKLLLALNDTRIKNYNTYSPGGKANALTSFLGSKLIMLLRFLIIFGGIVVLRSLNTWWYDMTFIQLLDSTFFDKHCYCGLEKIEVLPNAAYAVTLTLNSS